MQPIVSLGHSIYFSDNGYDALNVHLAQNLYSSIFILSDGQSNAHCVPHFLAAISAETRIEVIEIESGEQSKNIETCIQLWKVLTELGADRKSVIINVGGGVVSDIGGFVASTYKRGIDFINVPTTLLAMVDAAIGGKNGVDLGNLKNQVGVINPPKMVLADLKYLDTLPKPEMRSGLAEMLKHGLIYDKTYWEKFQDLNIIDFADFDKLIERSIAIKNEIVMRDPTENGVRKALNFGHTLGHAIESHFMESDRKTLLHGEAIAAGMILESFLSWKTNGISESDYVDIKSTIKRIFDDIAFAEADFQPILALLSHDKKNEYGKVQFALLEKIGAIKINQFIENELIRNAFDDYKT